jgi:hypothetical protein
VAYAWLDVSVRETVVVHELQGLDYLDDNLPCLGFGERLRKIALQISVRHVLHGDEDGAFVREPPV